MKQPPELVGRAYRFALAALRFYRKRPKSPDAQVPGEADESVGWLEFMRDGDIGADAVLLAEAKEICAMLTASVSNARANSR
jgi:hypothetical protein